MDDCHKAPMKVKPEAIPVVCVIHMATKWGLANYVLNVSNYAILRFARELVNQTHKTWKYNKSFFTFKNLD